jgi:hypothetical protein
VKNNKVQNDAAIAPVYLPNIMNSIDLLPKSGVIKSTENGYIYVDIDDEFIHKLFPLLSLDHIQMPDYFSEEKNYIGAHISLVYPEENTRSHFDIPSTLVDFDIDGIFSAVIGSKKYICLKVVSDAITHFREQFGLSELLTLKGCSVPPHITIAISND